MGDVLDSLVTDALAGANGFAQSTGQPSDVFKTVNKLPLADVVPTPPAGPKRSIGRFRSAAKTVAAINQFSHMSPQASARRAEKEAKQQMITEDNRRLKAALKHKTATTVIALSEETEDDRKLIRLRKKADKKNEAKNLAEHRKQLRSIKTNAAPVTSFALSEETEQLRAAEAARVSDEKKRQAADMRVHQTQLRSIKTNAAPATDFALSEETEQLRAAAAV